jgi:hypothetical protein
MRWYPLFWSSPSPRCAFSSLLLTSLPLPYSSTRGAGVSLGAWCVRLRLPRIVVQGNSPRAWGYAVLKPR